MALVGYSDVFRTQHGYVGGWILKNSWSPTPTQPAAVQPSVCACRHVQRSAILRTLGSGGMGFRQRMRGTMPVAAIRSPTSCRRSRPQTRRTHAQTRTRRRYRSARGPTTEHQRSIPALTLPLYSSSSTVHPHPYQNWYSCSSLWDCRSKKTATYAAAANSPLQLTCIDRSPFITGLCERGEPLFLKSIVPFGGGLSVACFYRDRGEATPPKTTDGGVTGQRRRTEEAEGQICSPPVTKPRSTTAA